jgi:hypothetical protein
VGFDLKWCKSGMGIAWGMERKWWFDGNENEGCVAWTVKMDYDGCCCSLKKTGK